MTYQNLKNMPLVESILELRWYANPAIVQEHRDENGNILFIQGSVDEHYQILLSRLFDKLSNLGYSEYKKVDQAIPDDLSGHKVQHRFTSINNDWPMVQIGHGIVTLNETKKYTWDDFKNRSLSLLELIHKTHPNPGSIAYKYASLRYINAFQFDFDKENIFDFMSNHMKTSVNYDDVLFSNNSLERSPLAFSVVSQNKSSDPLGLFSNTLARGKSDNKEAIVWDINFRSINEEINSFPEGFENWLNGAHHCIDDWFRKTIKGDLERRFKGEK